MDKGRGDEERGCKGRKGERREKRKEIEIERKVKRDRDREKIEVGEIDRNNNKT